MFKKIQNLYQMVGPGLLCAGAAVGVSHLVQSTRAGADFGFELVWVILLANLVKYPFFEMAPRYTAATGESLLVGYRRIGKWPVWVVILVTIATMFTVQAAVTIVTAGLAIEIFDLPLDAKMTSVVLLGITSVLLVSGRYAILDHFIKAIIIVLTLTTLLSLGGAIQIERVLEATNPFDWDDKTHLFFLVGLAGWMPAPLDMSVWHSIWIEEKGKLLGKRMSLREALFDFNVGYIATVVIAVCFLSLGALVMHGSGSAFSGSAAKFAGQVIQLYTNSLGSWTYPLIAIACFTTMLSTTITVYDAYPRVLRESFAQLFSQPESEKKAYNLWLVIVGVGTVILLYGFIQNMAQMVALATMLSFALAPVYAILNYLLLKRDGIAQEAQLSPLRSLICIAFIIGLVGFSIWFLSLKYF